MIQTRDNSIIEPRPIDGAQTNPLTTGTGKKLISICTPAYNEVENVETCYRAVCGFFEGVKDRYELEWIVTDNHSTDGTFDVIRRIAAQDHRVRGLRFSRNFGYQRSILTGYLNAQGDAAIQLDCDLEDPVSMIAPFLKAWENGHQVVYGIRRTRQEHVLLQKARRLFYWGLDKISEDHLPRDVGDFRLIDRRIIEELRLVDDPHIYIRGRIATLGFSQVGIPYDRQPRLKGTSKFNLWKLFGLALDATLSHSVVPLRIATFAGLLLCGATVLMIAGYSVSRLIFGQQWPAGFTTTVVLVLLGMGMNGLFLGIIGEYLARIYQHLKGTSRVIVMESTPTAGGGSAMKREPSRVAQASTHV